MNIKVLKTREDFKNANLNKPVGFVPTMGNLHNGHISLLEKSLIDNQTSVISIFVNPTQFAPGEDFDTYPRTFQSDREKIQNLANKYPDKEIVIFSPEDANVIYSSSPEQTEYDPGPVKSILEGKLRPTFFDGVTMVVRRLFEIVGPTTAYFGQKDYQQLFIIKKMVQDLSLPIKIMAMPIIREDSGLAMSSRNQYLSENQKKQALKVHQTLLQVGEKCKEDIDSALEMVTKASKEDTNWNYLSIRSSKDLSLQLNQDEVVILANYQMGTTKLLDNLVVKIK